MDFFPKLFGDLYKSIPKVNNVFPSHPYFID